MRAMLLIAAALAVAAAAASRAQAQDYPWCAYYGDDFGGSKNCGFVTLKQCLETLSGIGGFCDRSLPYPPEQPARRRAHRWHE